MDDRPPGAAAAAGLADPPVSLTSTARGQTAARARAARGWAGGPPSARAPFAWRALLRLMRVVATTLGMRLRVEGLEHVPSGGGYIVAAAPHRTWLDPFVLLFALPAEPRIYFLGDGEAMYRDPLRALFVRRLGGVVPIWRGSRGIEGHVAAIGQILAAGAVVALFPERGPAVPTERARPFAAGVGYLALRTGAPVVPAVIGGTHELYLRRRVVVRFLSPTPPPHAVHADHAERALAHAFRDALYAVVAPHVVPVLRMVEPHPGFKKRWRWLTNAFR